MKMGIKKKLPLVIAIIVVSIFVIIFASLSIINEQKLLYRILAQGSLSLSMTLSGIDCYFYRKQKIIGAFCWLATAFLIFVMFYTIYIGLQLNVLTNL